MENKERLNEKRLKFYEKFCQKNSQKIKFIEKNFFDANKLNQKKINQKKLH